MIEKMLKLNGATVGELRSILDGVSDDTEISVYEYGDAIVADVMLSVDDEDVDINVDARNSIY